MKYVFVIVSLFAVLASKAFVRANNERGSVIKAALYNNGPTCAVATEADRMKWILEKKSNDIVGGTVEISFNTTTLSDWHPAGEKSVRQSSVVDFILAAAFIPNANPISDNPHHACHRMMSLM